MTAPTLLQGLADGLHVLYTYKFIRTVVSRSQIPFRRVILPFPGRSMMRRKRSGYARLAHARLGLALQFLINVCREPAVVQSTSNKRAPLKHLILHSHNRCACAIYIYHVMWSVLTNHFQIDHSCLTTGETCRCWSPSRFIVQQLKKAQRCKRR